MGEAPAGTVTFLFTDIEGSTRLWEDRPDDMRVLVAEHDTRFRAAIEENHGYVVKGRGDGVHAAFARAADAVAAAVQAQASIADLSDIRARIGINTGEAQERDGDYFGPAVNRTARLMAAGHGGQVLLSSVTAELVPGLVVRNLGEHRLPDLGSPMLVLQLGTEEFPPLRTLDELPGNLPMQRTRFIGRANEVKELAELVATERLVTVTGAAGVGKSRLALQVAAEIASEFRGGAWFASLGGLEEGALVAATILEAVGASERRGEVAIDTLCAWGGERTALVVVDNCEHLLGAVAEVVDRLADSIGGVTILATSQAPLGVRGERLWAVTPMGGADGVSRDSVELFVDRAQLARADFALTAQNEASVAEICERLDHIPLAIELAAARVRGMTPADIVRRLDQRFRLLASSDRSAPGRHRTLDAAVRWSYELLDQTQRRVFDRLSVFAGPFTIDAAEAVVAGDGVDDWEVLDGLLALVDKSLVVADETGPDTRYRLLETMRQFGQANLAEAGTQRQYGDRHAAYYTDFVLSRRAQLHGSGDQAALEEVEREYENVRVALRQAAADPRAPQFEDLFFTLYEMWQGRRTSEGRAWSLELRGRTDIDPAVRILTLGFAASVASQSDPELGEELATLAIDLSDATGAAPALMATAVHALQVLMQGDDQDAVAGCLRVLDRINEEPDSYARAMVLTQCLACLATCGVVDRFDDIFRQVKVLADDLDNTYLRATWANSMAPIIHVIHPGHEREYLRRGHELNAQIGNYAASNSTLMFLALHELRAGDLAAAADAARLSLQQAIDFAPTYVAQTVNTVVPIVRRRSPADAAVLLGALAAHRRRNHLAGTQNEADAEARYEAGLRRILGDDFDAAYARGLEMGEDAMLTLAFAELDAISSP